MKDRVVKVLAYVILIVCAVGFGCKLLEFIRLVLGYDDIGQEGMFAVAPLVNYLLASAGFLCLLGWASTQGMFRDLEGPKQTLLDINDQLDAETDDLKYCNSVMK